MTCSEGRLWWIGMVSDSGIQSISRHHDVLPGELPWAPPLPAVQRHASAPPSLVDCRGVICFPRFQASLGLAPASRARAWNLIGPEAQLQFLQRQVWSLGSKQRCISYYLQEKAQSTLHGAALEVSSPVEAAIYLNPVIGATELQHAAGSATLRHPAEVYPSRA